MAAYCITPKLPLRCPYFSVTLRLRYPCYTHIMRKPYLVYISVTLYLSYVTHMLFLSYRHIICCITAMLPPFTPHYPRYPALSLHYHYITSTLPLRYPYHYITLYPPYANITPCHTSCVTLHYPYISPKLPTLYPTTPPPSPPPPSG